MQVIFGNDDHETLRMIRFQEIVMQADGKVTIPHHTVRVIGKLYINKKNLPKPYPQQITVDISWAD